MSNGRLKKLALSVLVAGSMVMAGISSQAGPIIKFGRHGLLKIDIKLQVRGDHTSFGSGVSGTHDRTDLHFQRARVTLTGLINRIWGVKFQTCGHMHTSYTPMGYMQQLAATNQNDRDIRIIDAYIIGNFSRHLHMKLGLTKIPLTRLNLIDCFAPLEVDRSFYAYTPVGTSPESISRNYGVVFWGTFLKRHLKYWIGAFQGREGQSPWSNSVDPSIPRNKIISTDTSPQPSNTNLMYVARLTYAFLDPEPGGSGYWGTYFGKRKLLVLGVGGLYQPNAVYKNVKWNPATGQSIVLNNSTADFKAFAADLLFEYPLKDLGVPNFTFQYLWVDVDDAYKTDLNPADQNVYVAGLNGQKHGWVGQFAYILPFKIGKHGLIQPYVGYEHWTFAKLLGVEDQKIDDYSVGINYYILGQNVRITAQFDRVEFDKSTHMMGVSFGHKIKSYNMIQTQFQVVF